MRAAAFRVLVFLALAGGVAFVLTRDQVGDARTAPIPSAAKDDAQAVRPAYRVDPMGCAAIFDEGEAHFENDAIAAALASCPGISADASSFKVQTSLAFGAEGLLEDAGLAGAVIARATSGDDPTSACGASRGVIAIVSLRGNRLEIDAFGDWTSGCGALEPLSVERSDAGAIVVVEPIEREPKDLVDAEGDEPERELRQWVKRGNALVTTR